MAIPDFQSLMLPLLEAVRDGGEHQTKSLVETLAKRYQLTQEERTQLLPSGKSPTFDNRVGWAKTYLKKAGLLEQPKRSFINISKRGLEVLAKAPLVINMKYLEQFPEYISFKENEQEKQPSNPQS